MERGDLLMAHQPNKRILTLLGVGSGGYRTPTLSGAASVSAGVILKTIHA